MFKSIDQRYHSAPKIAIKLIAELNTDSQNCVSRALSWPLFLQSLKEDSLLSCEALSSQ